MDKAIAKLFFMYYGTEQTSKYSNAGHTQKLQSKI